MRNPKIKIFRGKIEEVVEKQFNDWIEKYDAVVNIKDIQMHTTDNKWQEHTITILVKYEK